MVSQIHWVMLQIKSLRLRLIQFTSNQGLEVEVEPSLPKQFLVHIYIYISVKYICSIDHEMVL